MVKERENENESLRSKLQEAERKVSMALDVDSKLVQLSNENERIKRLHSEKDAQI
jgi:cellobiose-specific phosphotransferase system component IIA